MWWSFCNIYKYWILFIQRTYFFSHVYFPIFSHPGYVSPHTSLTLLVAFHKVTYGSWKEKKKIISNFPPFIHISVYLSTENQLSMQNTQFLGNLASFKEFSIKTCFSLHLFTKGGTMWYLTFSMTPVVFKHPVKQSLNS